MRPQSRCVQAVVTLAAIMGCVGGAVAQPSNDNCTNPLQITGSGTFQFDFSQAAMDIPFISTCGGGGGIDLSRDLWFCWTANCTGLVTITTCGQTTINTTIAIYPGCACPPTPGQPLCCNDDGPTCAPQSEVRCEVVCGQQYMIQLGEREFGGLPGGSGTFSIACEGTPCGDHECPPGVCCGGTPDFTGFAGPVSVATILNLNPAGNQVQFVDLSNSSTAPPGANWGAATFATPHASWSRQNLGTVFGVAIDDQGNAYVAHTSVYGNTFLGMPFVDAVGSGGPGAIYKISSATGVATPFITLPNSLDPIISAQPGYANEAWPGLGNISIDCSRNTLFASNFDDGRIYRISLSSGAVLSAFDHATNTFTPGGAPESTDTAGFVRLGERVWAVEPHNGRLYYSIWGSDLARNVAPNTIWSIQLDPITGEFIPSTRQQEILNGLPPAQNQSPTSDIAFTPSGSMLTAQRTMGDGNPLIADTIVWAHNSYLHEFVCNASGTWDPGANFSVSTNGASTAGGVDVDYRPSQTYTNYATADALVFDVNTNTYVYGMQGLAPGGGSVGTSLLLDLDQDTSSHDKTSQGSVEISCPAACAEIESGDLLCRPRQPGSWIYCYDYTFTVTNLSGQSVAYILIPHSSVTPNVIGPFAPGTFDHGDSQTITVQVCGLPNTVLTFPVILMNTEFEECCHRDIDLELPECDCFQLTAGPTVTDLGNGQYTISFTYQPIDFNVGHVFFDYEPGVPAYNVTVTPTYVPTNVPQWGTQTFTANFTIVGGGNQPINLCFRMFIHTPDLSICCSELICVRINGGGSTGCPGDLNGDGVVDLSDLALLLSAFGTSTTTGDIDGDGDVDLTDLAILLSHFGTPC